MDWPYSRMPTEIDIYRSAHLLIKQYGDDAPIQAAMRADELLERGDIEGRAVWLRILKAVEELQATGSPDPDQVVH